MTLDGQNRVLIGAFPPTLRVDATFAVSLFPEDPFSSNWGGFSLRVGSDLVAIPYRIYHNPALINASRLTSLQKELVNCLFTRHHDGFVRQEHLARIISSENIWVPPFVVKLVGEYVIEILQVIRDKMTHLNPAIYKRFLQENPGFFAVTKQRVTSYWNCYYRSFKKEDYVGFQLLEYFQAITKNGR
jgi:hypothetical protein